MRRTFKRFQRARPVGRGERNRIGRRPVLCSTPRRRNTPARSPERAFLFGAPLRNPPPLRGRVGWGVVQQGGEDEVRQALAAAALRVFRALSRVSPHPAPRADLPRKGGGEANRAKR